jgi:3-phosphoglycerate kinase
MKCIDEMPAGDLKGERVLVRVDYNLPLNEQGEVSDLFRLKQGWKTIQYLARAGARVLVLSHIGRDPEETMEPVAKAAKQLGQVAFVKDITGPLAQEASAVMKDGEIAILENVRRDARETGNDEGFAKELSALADIYVDDAFAAAHRAHASIVGVPKFLPHYAGFLMRDEVKNIDAARVPRSPSVAILGGAKFETKAPLIKLLLEKYDRVLVVGALANDVFKARGLPTGRSLISKELPESSILDHPHFLAPVDVTVENSAGQASVKKPEAVGPDDKIVDIGPDTVAQMTPLLTAAQFILWAGPTGMYEKGYLHYTQGIAEAIAMSKGQKVIGGGDTIAAIEATGVDKAGLGFLSTGGGAMLEYLLKGTLPGVEALN